MMILVTGAAGKTGRAVIRALAARGETVRALIHRPAQVSAVQAAGAAEVVSGDMRQPSALAQAMQGVVAVYHICPNMSPDEFAMGRIAINAAVGAGVRRFVFHSVLHPQVEAMPHHWQKMRIEEYLFQSGLAYTILQPAAYMQNVLVHWEQIVEAGIYPVPYAVETRLGMVDLTDVAKVAAIVLTEAGHEGATYELATTETFSQAELASLMAAQLGRTVRAEAVSVETWKAQARAAGLGHYQLETLVKMFRYYERYGFVGNGQVLAGLLAHPPTTFTAFFKREVRKRYSNS